MADTLEELMTDEPRPDHHRSGAAYRNARNEFRAELRPLLDAELGNAKEAYGMAMDAIDDMEKDLRALRESHDALFMALVTCERKLEEEAPLTEGVAWALDKAKAALDNAQPLTARAALAKAEALQ